MVYKFDRSLNLLSRMSQSRSSTSSLDSSYSNPEHSENTETSSNYPDPSEPDKATGSKMLSERPAKRSGKRPGRKPSKIDVKAKLERSRQSARECRARKKLRYQYLEELVLNREQAIFTLRDELEMYKQCCIQVDKGIVTDKLISMIQQDSSSEVKSTSGQRSASSYPGSRQTSTVTSGTQSIFGTSRTPQGSPNIGGFGNVTRSRSFEQASHFGGSSVPFQGSNMSSQLHGAGARVHDTSMHFPTSSHVADAGSSSNIGHFSGSQFVADNSMNPGSMYSNPTQYDVSAMGSITDYHSPAVTTASQGYINLRNMNIPNTSRIPDDPVATLTAITNPSSILPTYDMAVSYNPQPSTSQTSSSTTDAMQWFSILAELDQGLSRPGAESAAGTPQSVDGVRTLPTVLHEFHDSDSSSDT